MKIDKEVTDKTTFTFNKAELVDIMIEAYQKNSGTLLCDVDKSKCRIFTNGSTEVRTLELIYINEVKSGQDYNGV